LEKKVQGKLAEAQNIAGGTKAKPETHCKKVINFYKTKLFSFQ
jgi:hypothetical protein